jgi:stalled ribosome rescue protein Dom34
MKNIGIWMDREKAHIVRLYDEEDNLETIFSEMEFFNRKGSSGPRVKSGATQDITHDRTYLEREKAQLKAYFKKLADAIADADAIALFGPADTNEKFRKELLEHYKDLAGKVKTVTKADSMTENQTKALVRDFFNPQYK